MAEQPEKLSFWERLKQIGVAFKFTAARDKLFIPLVALAIVVPLLVAVVWTMLGGGWTWILVAVSVSLLGTMLVLNFRVNSALMNEAEGKPAAAVAIVRTLRGDWRITPAVQATTQQDMVHRAIGRPGIVLLAEGGGRARSLLNQERKRLGRVVGSTPIYDYMVGEQPGQLSIRKLRKTLGALPKNITSKQVQALDTRLTALNAGKPQMPQGPIPKNLRPKGMNRMLRGR